MVSKIVDRIVRPYGPYTDRPGGRFPDLDHFLRNPNQIKMICSKTGTWFKLHFLVYCQKNSKMNICFDTFTFRQTRANLRKILL